MLRTLSTLATVFVALGLAAGPAAAQDAVPSDPHDDASTRTESARVVTVSPGFGAFGHRTLQLAAGGETYRPDGLGFGFELGYVSPGGDLGDGFLALSPSALYRFDESGRLQPYVRGGGTVWVGAGILPLVHVGGGTNVRLDDRFALQVEARQYASLHPIGGHFQELRLGLVIWER